MYKMISKPFVLNLLLIVTWTRSDHYVTAAGCEDIQSLMDNTVREDCTAAGMVTRGGSICVPKLAGPLLLFYRHLSSQPLAMRSFSKDQDEQLMIGYYPKLDKCFLITRTQCQIKAATFDSLEPRVFWIEFCPPSLDDHHLNDDETKVSLHRVNLDGTGHDSTPFTGPLENWYTINLTLDSVNKKIYVITYQETFECEISGTNCVTLDRPSEGTLLASQIDQ